MKKVLLFSAFLFPFIVSAQAIPGAFNFMNCDTITLEDNSYFAIEFDTSASNIWQTGNPNKTVFTAALGGTNCIVTDTVNTYPEGNTSRFIIKWEDQLQNNNCWGPGKSLMFVTSMNTDDAAGGYIEYSDNGVNWINVFDNQLGGGVLGIFKVNNFNAEPQPLPFGPDTLYNGELGFKGDMDADTFYIYYNYLIIFRETDGFFSPQLRFTFTSETKANPYDGWMLDQFVFGKYDVLGSVSESLSKSITLYPNPANDKLAFDFDENKFKPTELTITNVLGQQILKVPFSKTLDISTLQQGVYYVTITDDKGNSAAKMFYKQ
jgi:hypothetical protein